MRYLLKYIRTAGGSEDLTPEQWQTAVGPWQEFDQELIGAGAFVAGDALQPSDTATTVRLSESGETVTDGPFAETKEQLGGFHLLECADLDEALAWAKKVPMEPGGAVEVTPVVDLARFGYPDPYEAAAASR